MEKLYVYKEIGDKKHPYTITNLEALMDAAQDLSSDGLRLWIAISTLRSDRANYVRANELFDAFGFSSKEQYSDAVIELMKKGYIFDAIDSNKKMASFAFFEKKQEIEEEEVAI